MKTKSIFKGIFGVIMMLTISLTFIQCDSAVDKVLKQTSDEMNKQCPMTLNEIVRLDNTEALPGKILKYNYTITDASNFDAAQVKEAGIPMAKNLIKTNAQMEPLRKLEVTFRYYYKDNDGKELLTYDITPSDYK